MRHAAGRPGVIHFSAEQAANLGQKRAFWLHLWRVARLPVTPVWFPGLSDPTGVVVGSASQTMRRELEVKTKEGLLGGICGWFDKVSGHPCGRSLTEALAFSCFNLPL